MRAAGGRWEPALRHWLVIRAAEAPAELADWLTQGCDALDVVELAQACGHFCLTAARAAGGGTDGLANMHAAAVTGGEWWE